MEKALELVSLLYSCVADSSHWPPFLQAFAGAIGCERAALLIHNTEGDGFAVVCWHGWPDEDIQLYLNRYGAIDPWRIGVAPFPAGSVRSDFDIWPREQMEASATFREFYAPRDCIHSMGGVILVTATGRSYISAHRGSKKGPFGEFERAILGRLMEHLKQAALLHGVLGSLRRQLATFTDHLNRYSHAFLLTDPECRVLYANAAAREVTGLRDGLALDDGRIAITSSRQNATLREAATELSAGRGPSLRRLVASRPSKRRSYRLILMPVDHSGSVPLGVAVPAVSILVVDAELRPDLDVPVLCELFSLTPAEARVAGKLALGRSVEEIASEARISVETVRTHLKRALSKTGTERQGELISLILRSVPLGRPGDASHTQFG
jgi:DNA-binding CsgD family transcriptional regulator